MRDEKLHAVVARSTMHNTHQVRTTFGSWDVEKVHAVVARSTFRSQNVQNTPFSDHFWKLRCRKSARSCGAKHISKSKCTKHTILGPLLEVEMSKKCTPLWREAHFEVKMYKTHHSRTTFGSWDVEKVHAIVARSTFRSQNVQNTRGSDHSWRFRCRFAWQAQGNCAPCQKWVKREGFLAFSTTTTTTPHYTPIHYTTLHYNYNYTFTTLYYITLHYTTLHSITLNYTYTTLHYTTLHFTTLHYITLHDTTFPLHFTTLHYTTLHNTTTTTTQLHSTTLNYSTLHYITLHSTRLHYTTLHYTTLHYTTLHYTTLHWMTLRHR